MFKIMEERFFTISYAVLKKGRILIPFPIVQLDLDLDLDFNGEPEDNFRVSLK